MAKFSSLTKQIKSEDRLRNKAKTRPNSIT